MEGGRNFTLLIFVNCVIICGHFSYSYGGNNSFWVVGTRYVSDGFSGYLGKLTVNQYTLVEYKQLEHYFKPELEELEAKINKEAYKQCHVIRSIFKSVVYGDVENEYCDSYPFVKLEDLLGICFKKKNKIRKRMKISLSSQALEEELGKVKTGMEERFPLREEFGSFLYELVLKNIVSI